MTWDPARHPMLVVVGSGGVGKTTVAAALGLAVAMTGRRTLVMTFDPSLRLKDTLGVGDAARDREVEVPVPSSGSLHASLLDARLTFDRLVARYAPDTGARRRILENRFYRNLAGQLAGILEYMAVERLYEVAEEQRYDAVVLDTPPTRQAIDFLEAPERIVSFLDSGVLRLALRPWFDEAGHLRGATRLGPFGRGVESLLDRVVGLTLLREMAEFFQAFEPLYDGFRRRADEVRALLRSDRTRFALVSGPGEERIPDAMFFARHLETTGYHLGPVIVNRVHPEIARVDGVPEIDDGAPHPEALLRWLGRRDRRGLDELRGLLPGKPLVPVPLMPRVPADLESLAALGARLLRGGAET